MKLANAFFIVLYIGDLQVLSKYLLYLWFLSLPLVGHLKLNELVNLKSQNIEVLIPFLTNWIRTHRRDFPMQRALLHTKKAHQSTNPCYLGRYLLRASLLTNTKQRPVNVSDNVAGGAYAV